MKKSLVDLICTVPIATGKVVSVDILLDSLHDGEQYFFLLNSYQEIFVYRAKANIETAELDFLKLGRFHVPQVLAFKSLAVDDHGICILNGTLEGYLIKGFVKIDAHAGPISKVDLQYLNKKQIIITSCVYDGLKLWHFSNLSCLYVLSSCIKPFHTILTDDTMLCFYAQDLRCLVLRRIQLQRFEDVSELQCSECANLIVANREESQLNVHKSLPQTASLNSMVMFHTHTSETKPLLEYDNSVSDVVDFCFYQTATNATLILLHLDKKIALWEAHKGVKHLVSSLDYLPCKCCVFGFDQVLISYYDISILHVFDILKGNIIKSIESAQISYNSLFVLDHNVFGKDTVFSIDAESFSVWNCNPAPPSKMNAPIVEKNDIFVNSCQLQFSTPPANGFEITHFVVGLYRIRSHAQDIRSLFTYAENDILPGNKLEVKDLVAGETYKFSIFAVNNSGSGPESDCSDLIKTRAGVPETIQRPTVSEITCTSILLHWVYPFDGGSRIQHFVISMKGERYREFEASPLIRVANDYVGPDQLYNEGEGYQCYYKITDLRPQYSYRFKVAAENIAGLATFSLPTFSVETGVISSK